MPLTEGRGVDSASQGGRTTRVGDRKFTRRSGAGTVEVSDLAARGKLAARRRSSMLRRQERRRARACPRAFTDPRCAPVGLIDVRAARAMRMSILADMGVASGESERLERAERTPVGDPTRAQCTIFAAR